MSRGQLARGAAVAETDFAPLYTGAQRSFSAIVGGPNAILLARRFVFGVGGLLIQFGYPTPQFLKLSLQPLIFTLQLLTAGLG